ncbi:AAA family ATPase [Succinimonas sp.]|uniref:AAA family ATPase n=1 Tax=Succinimonas sp. TaxID=1936151 RepID=UPI00386CAFD9
MGTFVNPGSNNPFTELAAKQDSWIFVDKTDFIGETIDRLDAGDLKLIAFTKPRRFGKTVTAHMLASYYSKGADCKTVFSGLKVAGYAGTKTINGQKKKITYEEYLNKCNVILLDMNNVNYKFRNYVRRTAKIEEVSDIVDFTEYLVIKELKEDPEFAPILTKAGISNIGINDALSEIHQKLNISFVFLMDEWDLIYREYRDNETLQEKFIDMLAGLFKATEGLSCFSLAYLTGILPIKKYNSESALNNFDEYNMLQPDTFAPYFGFTDEEVTEICKQPMCSISKDLLKEWYEGYKFTLDAKDKEHKNNVLIDVYNPNSVCKAISRNNCGNFWSSTSSNKEAIRLINMNFAGIKDDILSMLAGGTVFFNFRSFNSNMVSITSKDQVFSLLTCLGYLGCNGQPNAGTERYAYVPNREIRETLIDIVREQPWYNSMPVIERSEKLFQAIRSLNAKTTAEIVGGIHNSPYVSVIGYNKEEALVFCLISGLMWCAESSYDSFRELPAGKGFADLVFVPKSRADLPIMIIEFKRDYSAEDALNQIKEQDYAARYRQDGDVREVLLVGLNYSSETKEHHCVIEKMPQKN